MFPASAGYLILMIFDDFITNCSILLGIIIVCFQYSQSYNQESYDDGYPRRDQYVEETYPEPTPVSSS